jgi:hypothetical protein
MKKKTNMILLITLIACFLFASTAYALAVSFVSKSLPGSATIGYTYSFGANIEYDTHISGIPTPQLCKYFLEVPRKFAEPTFNYGSLTGFKFTSKTGEMTGEPIWETYQRFWLFGVEQRGAYFRARANYSGSSQSYVGTGPSTAPAAHYYRSVKVTY